jgi:parallel beta-helix repeat protein
VIIKSAATISGCRIYSNTGRAGGGGALYLSPAVIRHSVIASNTASSEYGGGMAIWASDGFVVDGNSIFNNQAQKGGGGLDVYESDGSISANEVRDNHALTENGGGLHISDGSDASVTSNVVYANFAAAGGGGIVVFSNTAAVENNLVFSNTAGNRGGGLALINSRATVVSNTIRFNSAAEEGGGVCVDQSQSQLRGNLVLGNATGRRGGGMVLSARNNLTLINNVVARNHITSTDDAHGAGIFIYGSQVQLTHNTIADNTGGDGREGVHITGAGADVSTARFTNTVIAGQDAALEIHTANTAVVNGALWFDVNEVSRGGAGHFITVTNDYTGDPRFANRAAGDYHIGRGSAALDRGVPTSVVVDRDHNPRPVGLAPDLGAYEYQSAERDTYLPVVRKQ